jgi:phosphatidylserine/phosphatidylglycerophosphate/cardiolipin synthase-like enzyme
VAHAAGELGLTPPPDLESSETISSPPSRSGNEVRLLINGEASFAQRFGLLDEAKKTIYIQALIFKADTVGRAIADRLLARKKQDPSLDIRVIVDAYSNIQDVDAQLMYFELMNAGIAVEGFEAFYLHWVNEINLADWVAGNKRYHEKYWIIDGERAVVGGMNIADEYARCTDDPVLIWRDQDVYLSGPVVADVERAFIDNFERFKAIKDSKPRALNTDAYWETWRTKVPGGTKLLDTALETKRAVTRRIKPQAPKRQCDGDEVPSATQQDVDVRFIRSRPREGEQGIHQAYLERIAAAKTSILIENAYFVPSKDLSQALMDAARRGVGVQVVNNSDLTNDIPVITKAGRVRYLELIDAGVVVYEWHGERHHEGTLHAKFAVFDEQVTIIGSYNLDPRSQGLNSEDVVVINHPKIAAELASYAREADLPMAERVTREQAVDWADPASLPDAPKGLGKWTDPGFDRRAFEFVLLRQLESSL